MATAMTQETNPPGPPAGWVPPAAVRPMRGRAVLIVALVIGGLLIAGSLLAMSFRPGTIQSVGFGTGGSECTLEGAATTFPLGAKVRDVVTFLPPLTTGTTIKIRVDLDGVELVEYGETLTVDEPTPCIYGAMSPEKAGHYRVEYAIDPATTPPIVGEFDVTS